MTSVTVLTPTYNRVHTLARTLATVRLQEHQDIRHIVLDGGSTDGTQDLLARAAERWGVEWVSGRDGGMYHALNKGLEMTSSEVVGWVNDDDWLLPWTVSTVVDEMARQQEPVAVYGDIVSLDGLDATAGHASVYGRFDRQTLAAAGTLAQPTVFWPRSATDTVGPLAADRFDEIADCEYWLRLSAQIPFVKSREFLAVVVNHDQTKRTTLDDKIQREWADIRAIYVDDKTSTSRERWRFRLAWRRELLAGLLREGWPATRASDLVVLVRPGLVRGPWRPFGRHALRRPVADLAPFVARLDELGAELTS